MNGSRVSKILVMNRLVKIPCDLFGMMLLCDCERCAFSNHGGLVI